ncbi:MAG: hypothetical protein ACYC27_03630 [Armatimonadota bacterium]
MQKQFNIYGIILLILGIIGVISAIAALIFLGIMASGINEKAADMINNSGIIPGTVKTEENYSSYELYIPLVMVILVTIQSVLQILAGVGLMKRRAWARAATIIVSIISLPSPPLGTALGVYGLWLMYSTDGISGWREYLRGTDIPAVS